MLNICLFMAVRAELVLSLWNLPGVGIEPKSPALADGFLSIATPGKSPPFHFIFSCLFVVAVSIRLTKFFTFLDINPH